MTNINARLNSLREQQNSNTTVTGPSTSESGGGAAAPQLQKLELFFSGQVSSGEVDSKQLQQDADLSGSQITFGADYRLSKEFIVGAGLGVFQHDTDFTNTAGGSDLEGINATLFSTFSRDNIGYIDIVLDIGGNSFDFSRQLNLVEDDQVLVSSSTDSSSFSLSIGLGKNFLISGFDLAPYIRAELTTAKVDGYSERVDSEQFGFGSALRVNSQSRNSTTVSMGATIMRVINTRRAVLIPQMSLEAELEADSDKDPLSAFFLADPNQQVFSVLGESRDESYANLGLGATAIFASGKSAYAYYETRLAHDAISQRWFKFGFRSEFQ